MLRHIKYEYRKNLVLYIVFASLLLAIEALILIALYSKDEVILGIAFAFVFEGIAALVVFFMVMSIVTFARELGSKSSYLSFMTPSSPYVILGAKYVSMLLTTTVATVLIVVFTIVDVQIIQLQFPDTVDLTNNLLSIFRVMGWGNPINTLLSILAVGWFSIITIVCLIFLAISLSNTILENSRGKGGLTLAFIVGMALAVFFLFRFLPTFTYGEGGWYILGNMWLHILCMVILSGGSYYLSAMMLSKRLSL